MPEDTVGRPISVVCVFNNVDVLDECLARSVEAYVGDIEVEFLPIDNTAHEFATAGAALNHGVGRSTCDVVVFAHQDVFLHSIERLFDASRMLSSDWGLIGANGVSHEGLNIGRIRDRVQVIGKSARTPEEVDSVDEVLFMARREILVDHPISEDPLLAWHAYAVEYGLRLRSLGFRVGATDLGVTHNSLTVNLAKLDLAHERVGDLYPLARPINTTCGVVGRSVPQWRSWNLIQNHGWRLRWLRHSALAMRARHHLRLPVVLSDIRHEVDLLPISEARPLRLINLDRGGFAEYANGELDVTRYGEPVHMHAVDSIGDILHTAQTAPSDDIVLIVGLGLTDLSQVEDLVRDSRIWLLGIHPGSIWLLGGVDPKQLPTQWSERQARPLLGAVRNYAG